ncbi:hypothetical protein [Methylobacterium sp. P5_C11]
MTDRLLAPRSLTARTALLVGLVLAHGPASAGSGRRITVRSPAPHVLRVRPVPAVPPTVLVRGYLPRNHNVPMYNEPPRREPAW